MLLVRWLVLLLERVRAPDVSRGYIETRARRCCGSEEGELVRCYALSAALSGAQECLSSFGNGERDTRRIIRGNSGLVDLAADSRELCRAATRS